MRQFSYCLFCAIIFVAYSARPSGAPPTRKRRSETEVVSGALPPAKRPRARRERNAVGAAPRKRTKALFIEDDDEVQREINAELTNGSGGFADQFTRALGISGIIYSRKGHDKEKRFEFTKGTMKVYVREFKMDEDELEAECSRPRKTTTSGRRVLIADDVEYLREMRLVKKSKCLVALSSELFGRPVVLDPDVFLKKLELRSVPLLIQRDVDAFVIDLNGVSQAIPPERRRLVIAKAIVKFLVEGGVKVFIIGGISRQDPLTDDFKTIAQVAADRGLQLYVVGYEEDEESLISKDLRMKIRSESGINRNNPFKPKVIIIPFP